MDNTGTPLTGSQQQVDVWFSSGNGEERLISAAFDVHLDPSGQFLVFRDAPGGMRWLRRIPESSRLVWPVPVDEVTGG